MLRHQAENTQGQVLAHGESHVFQGIFQTNSVREINQALSSYHEFDGSQASALYTSPHSD